MPKRKILMTILAIAGATAAGAWAQPPDFAVFPGDEQARQGRQGRWQGDRLEKMTEYLELSDAQATEWQAIGEQHTEAMVAHRERVGALREQFRQLAEHDDPDLEQVGQIALDLHREMETASSSRGELIQELEQILTPEQAERLTALRAAREMSGDRGHRGPRGSKNRPERD